MNERQRRLHAQLEGDEATAVQLPITEPGAHDLIHAARLLMRYPSADETQFGHGVRITILNRLAGWGMDEADLFRKTRELWAEGYKPEHLDLRYGSGGDVQGSDGS